jgi:integrase
VTIRRRGGRYWLDVTVNGERTRESLETSDWREAKQRQNERIAELSKRPSDPAKRRRTYAQLDVAKAIGAYSDERRAQVSPRMVAYWKENAKPLAAFFGDKRLRAITSADIAAYQNARIDSERAPKTVNGEISVLRQVLRHARLWYRLQDDYRALKNTRPPAGQALTDEQQQKLFEVARSQPRWMFAYVAAALAFYCGLRACEIRGLRWKHIDWDRKRLSVRRSKTPAGWRDPSLNQACVTALSELHQKAKTLGYAEPDQFVFPWHGRDKQIDATRSMTSWRSAWRSLRRAAGLPDVRFHDGRHTALTRLAEAGQPDWVIQAQIGHVSPQMMKTYSHIRRVALDEAAAVLEPTFEFNNASPAHDAVEGGATDETATSQSTSQSGDLPSDIAEILKESGSSGWIRTSNPPVNSRMLCR